MICKKCYHENSRGAKYCAKCGTFIKREEVVFNDVKGYYSILGVNPSSSTEEIKQAFRFYAHKFHPDKNGGNDNIFKKINEAYQILGNSANKEKYDQERNFVEYNSTQTKGKKSKISISGSSVLILSLGFLIGLGVILDSNQDYSTSTSTKDARVVCKDSSDYSEENGLILKRIASNFKGFGSLEIKNGTDQDSIAKLVRLGQQQSSISIYIKAGNVATIKNISNGTYELLFSSGNDFDILNNTFKKCQSYEKFEDSFVFSTTNYDDGIEYNSYRVTLYPVVGGSAETFKMNGDSFNSY